MNFIVIGRPSPASVTESSAFRRSIGGSPASFHQALGAALLLATLLAAGLAPKACRACACGCGIFDVGTSSMFPTGTGETVFFEDDYQNQTTNWSGSSKAPAADNPDKDIRTDFATAGFQAMFDRSWGIRLEASYDRRHFETTGGATGDDLVSLNWSSPGDTRIQGIYTGFSPDLSSGLTFGLKLPTGSFTHNDAYGDVDRDSEIGTGSTDLLLGGFTRGDLAGNHDWHWFAQANLDLPEFIHDQYRPGLEVDSAAGIYPTGWSLGKMTITLTAQVKVSARGRDTGSNAASPVASGFRRVLLAPGFECDVHPFALYADVELPVYQHFTGDQLSAPALFKVAVSYMF